MTSVPTAPLSSSSDFEMLSTVSISLKSGAFVPKGNIFEGVNAIFFINFKDMEKIITFEDFTKIDLRVGTIIEVNDFPEARNPAYQLTIDFGDLGIKKSSAQITTLYSKADLQNCQIVAVVNFPKKQIAKFMSECLVMGAVKDDDVYLLQPESKVKNGSSVN